MHLHGKDATDKAEDLLGRPLTDAEHHIAGLEGYSYSPYLDTKDVLTSGFGQTGRYLRMPFDKVVSIFEDRTRQIVPAYDELPAFIRLRLLDSTYRGGLSGSPKTLKLINAGDWEEAAVEFLNNDEFIAAVESGSGVASRMQETSDAMLEMAIRGRV
jgi:GH24 family phage-related lysozyme (muramidase)